MLLYPQLPRPEAHRLALWCAGLDSSVAEQAAALDHPDVYFSPTGGRRATQNEIRGLRELMVSLALANGYPSLFAEDGWASFDKEAAVAIHSAMDISANEAACPGVWEFITCVLLCDVVRWRFPGGSQGTPGERFLSGRRNTFQRLWWRAFILDDSGHQDRYHLLRALGEDEVVQIMERPFLAGSGPLARAVAREFLNAATRHSSISRRHFIREAQKYIRRLAAFTAFDAVDPAVLDGMVRDIFEQVAKTAAPAKVRVRA
jgi:hypothetical protein